MDIKELQAKKKTLEKELDTIDKQLAKVHTESLVEFLTESGFVVKEGWSTTYYKIIDNLTLQVKGNSDYLSFQLFVDDTTCIHDDEYEVTSEKEFNTFKDLIANLKVTKAVAVITMEAPVFMIKGITNPSTDGLIDTAFENYDIPESLVTQRSLKLL